MKPTPGPWNVQYNVYGHSRLAVTTERNVVVAEIVDWPTESITDANARLIAAAPELLEMLETLADGLEWNIDNIIGMNESDSEALTAARALIAKARGD